MAYIGKEPIVGNFQKCDAITVVNGQATYTLQVSSTNVVPESVNHMLVSLNGILQAPTTSFTVSGSTLTFASNLATGDVIDFVILLGNVLDLGTPSDGTVTNAKLASDLISGETDIGGAIADADLMLLDDGAGGTLRKSAMSRVKTYVGDNTPYFHVSLSSAQTVSDNTSTKIQLNDEAVDSDSDYDNSSNYRFTPTTAGKYFVYLSLCGQSSAVDTLISTIGLIKKNTSGTFQTEINSSTNYVTKQQVFVSGIADMNGSSDYFEFFGTVDVNGTTPSFDNANTFAGAYRIIE